MMSWPNVKKMLYFINECGVVIDVVILVFFVE